MLIRLLVRLILNEGRGALHLLTDRGPAPVETDDGNSWIDSLVLTDQ